MKIDFNLFPRWTPLAGLIFAVAPTFTVGIAWAMAQEPGYAPQGCRVTRQQLGVYEEPNTTSAARGLIQKDVTVLLGVGSGEGWARITSPQTGWVQSRLLKGNDRTPCPASLSSTSSETTPPKPASTQLPQTITPRPPRPNPARPNPARPNPLLKPEPTVPQPPLSKPTRVVRAVCEVKPTDGLLVRDTPVTTSSRIIGQIRPGKHTFQFSDRRLESETSEGLRQWVYITAPAKGWISTGFAEGGTNLSGESCR